MAKSPRQIPNQYPQPLASLILKADAYRQASIIRQEVVTDLIELMSGTTDPMSRKKILNLIEKNFKAGVSAAEKAEELWPDREEAEEILQTSGAKPAAIQKNLRLFKDFDLLTKKSLQLLQESHANIQIIVEKLRARLEEPPAG